MTRKKDKDLKAFYDSKYNKSDKTGEPDFRNSILLSNGNPLASMI